MARDSDIDAERQHWNEHYAAHAGKHGKPSEFLEKYARILPRHGAALDIACGSGDNVVFLAKDLDVTGIDVSDVAIGLARAHADRASIHGRARFVIADAGSFLASEDAGKYALVTCINFFDPAIVPAMKRVLAPGGTIAIQAYTTRDERLVSSPRMEGKLVTEASLFEPAMFGGYWIIVNELDEFTDKEGRKRQRLNMIARKPQ